MKNKAFTLAEVLITLVIIGVIAAITVPSIIQSTHKLEYVTKLKKVYSTLTQATDRIMFEEGSPKSKDDSSSDGWASDVDKMYNFYKSYLNLAKDCGSETGCFNQNIIKHLNNKGSYDFGATTARRRVILADGTQVSFEVNSKTCSHNSHGQGIEDACGLLWVDINGESKPNTRGRDYFLFILKENGLYPAGCEHISCVGEIGSGCSCKVLTENAMNY